MIYCCFITGGISTENMRAHKGIENESWLSPLRCGRPDIGQQPGDLSNQALALFRTKIGEEIRSAVLAAEGHRARVDGLTSLAVFFGAIGA